MPIAIGYGAGGEARQPLGMAVIGGLIFSQLVTLYLTPVFFIYMGVARAGRVSRPLAHPSGGFNRPPRALTAIRRHVTRQTE